jgi:zinc transport system substrate-binding protein
MDNEHDEHEDEEDHEEEHEHDEHESDPHVWTSAFNALVIAKNIENKLIELNPENKDIFETNYKNFETELSSVKQSFFDSILDKTQDEFVVFHDAYNYLFNELNIDSSKKLVFRTSVLSDPSSAEMKELIDEITEN